MYKGINPTCHDFNSITATVDSASLLVGFSTGQIQLIDPIKKELSKLYNEEVIIHQKLNLFFLKQTKFSKITNFLNFYNLYLNNKFFKSKKQGIS